MAGNLIELKYSYNRNYLPKLTSLGAFLSGDKEAHVFRISIVDDAGDVDLTGASVSGWFIRDDRNEPDDATVPLTGRIEEGNIAVLPLSDGCYSVVGPFSLVIRVMLGESDATVFWARGRVVRSRTDNVPDTSAGRGLDELLAEIAAYAADVERMHEDVMGAASGSGNMPSGGTAGQILAKKSNTSFDTHWIDPPQGGSGTGNGTVTGVKIGDASYAPNASGVVDLSGMTAPNAASLNGKSADQYMLKTDTAADSAKLDGKNAKYYIQPRNLLDNSWWKVQKEIVNQRGQTIYTGDGYTIDRWSIWSVNGDASLTVNDSGLTFNPGSGGGTLSQKIPLGILESAKTYTLAVHKSNGETEVKTDGVTFNHNGECDLVTVSGVAETILWAALYEGEYTVENLPPYIPKGYSVELAECQRYFRRFGSSGVGGSVHIGFGQASTSTIARCSLYTGAIRIVNPSYSLNGKTYLRYGATDYEVVSVQSATVQNEVLYTFFESEGLTSGEMYALRFSEGAYLDISADL